MRKIFCVLGLCTAVNIAAVAQGEVPVDMYTGSPIIQVPLWTIGTQDISQSVGLSYNAGGIRLNTPSGRCGIGWSLLAGGSISRTLRALPDDFKGSGSDARTGWLYNSNGSYAANFSTASDLSASTCDESSEWTAIENLTYNADTEPDVFNFSFGGYSGKFIFDASGAIRTIPYQELQIVPTHVSGTDKTITEFTVTTDLGYIYKFSSRVEIDHWTEKEGTTSGSVEFFKRDFELFKMRGALKAHYATEWLLTEIKSPHGAEIDFTYQTAESLDSESGIEVYIWNPTTEKVESKKVFTEKKTGTSKKIFEISGNMFEVIFSYSDSRLSAINMIDSRNDNGLVRTFSFNYASAGSRVFLKDIQESANNCERLPATSFTYYAVDLQTGQSSFPLTGSNSYDHWGFYNGSTDARTYPKIYVYPSEALSERYRIFPIPGYGGTSYTLDGNDRTPNENAARTGTIQSITHSTGGVSTFEFELHRFYDATGTQDIAGGGLRIKSTTYFDGHNKNANITKSFTYLDGSNSSGRLISMPQYAIPTYEYRHPQTGAVTSYSTLSGGSAQQMYNHLVVRTSGDISSSETTHGSAVGYLTVKVSRPGAGYVKYQYHMPGVYAGSSSGNWNVTLNKFARASACPSMGIASVGGSWTYPYSPQPDIDIERGLVHTKEEFNEAGAKVKETTTTYQDIFKTSPQNVYGLHYANFPYSPTHFYGKYAQLTEYIRVPDTETVTEYDAANSSKNLSGTVSYTYGSPYHRYLSLTTSTNSDGTIYRSKYKYAPDYGTIGTPSGKPAEMIKKLQQERKGTLVEGYVTLQKSGGSEKAVSGSITIFDDFGSSTAIVPKSFLALAVESPITFSESSINGSNAFVNDPSYKVVQTIKSVDAINQPLTTESASKTVGSIHRGYSSTIPVVTSAYAEHDQFAFSDFETTSDNQFSESATVYGTGRTGKNALYPQVVLTATVQKGDAASFTLSFWFKKQSSSLDFNITVKNTALTSTYLDNTFTVTAAGTGFEYFEKPFLASAWPSAFVVQIQGQLTGTLPSSSPGLLPLIDDVGFYPEGAELTSYTYNVPFGATSVTANARTMFTTFDALGRTKTIADQDGNIVERKIYTYHALPPVLSASFNLPNTLVDLEPLTFSSGANECIEGESYSWDFDGTVISSGTTPSQAYTFTSGGTKTITLTVSKSGFTNAVVSKNIFIAYRPIAATMCVKGVTKFNACNNTVTETSSCASISTAVSTTGPHYEAAFEAIHSETGTINYQWYVRQMGTSAWLPSVTSQEYKFELDTQSSGYEVKCVISTPAGRTGEVTSQVHVLNCGDL